MWGDHRVAALGTDRTTGAAAIAAVSGATTVPEHIMPIAHAIGSGASGPGSGAGAREA